MESGIVPVIPIPDRSTPLMRPPLQLMPVQPIQGFACSSTHDQPESAPEETRLPRLVVPKNPHREALSSARKREVGACVVPGMSVGLDVGKDVGNTVGGEEGNVVGETDGKLLGDAVSEEIGSREGV
mmetsp:Transcript_11404/g.17357  ORF Transcript_11404/g.17357 Transcript_11404/m.17357 type:complete len:127 (-) Transcript_11404:252-632(-)